MQQNYLQLHKRIQLCVSTLSPNDNNKACGNFQLFDLLVVGIGVISSCSKAANQQAEFCSEEKNIFLLNCIKLETCFDQQRAIESTIFLRLCDYRIKINVDQATRRIAIAKVVDKPLLTRIQQILLF